MATMETVVLESPDDIRFNSLKDIDLCDLPLSLLARDPAWKFFAADSLESLSNDAKLCKVSEGDRSYLGVLYYANQRVCGLAKLDSRVRMRDIKGISAHGTSQGVETLNTLNGLDRSNISSRLSNTPFARAEIASFWSLPARTKPQINLNLDPFFVPHPDTPLEILKTKYHEALYVNKASLAYFAKSTLSKLRLMCGSDQSRLLQVLNSCVLTLDALDTKYMRPMIEFRDILKRIRKSKDLVPPGYTKDELYYLGLWDQRLKSKDEQTLKRYFDELKIQEIQLQIVVLLEILSISGNTTEKTSKLPKKPSKSKVLVRKRAKPAQDLKAPSPPLDQPNPSLHVDLLFDRLCIWQAVQGGTLRQPDKVLEFTYEVVLPYFMSALPEKTRDMLQRAKGSSGKKDTASKKASKPLSGQPGQSLSQRPDDQEVSILPAAKPRDIRISKERWQVEMTRTIKKENIAEELAMAIKNVAKPNRAAVTTEQHHSPARNAAAVQVPGATWATPSKKRVHQHIQVTDGPQGGYMTPKRPRSSHEIVIHSSPIKSPVFVMWTPVREQVMHDEVLMEHGAISPVDCIHETPQRTKPVMSHSDSSVRPFNLFGSSDDS